MIKKNLAEWLNYLEKLHPSSIDMGLNRLQKVAEKLALAKPAPLVITVTGTNGKGSTCAFITALLACKGLKVGLYTSPHLLHYQERICINNEYVSEDSLCQAFETIDSARGDISLTYFEMGTLAAFWLFQQASLDAVVLEVGLGGRLDAVNLIDADISVVTSIGIDHTEWLGNTRDSVAFEKAGIFRKNKPAVCGDDEPPYTLIEQAKEKQTPLFTRGHDFNFTLLNDHWQWQGKTKKGEMITLAPLPLLSLPIQNAATALEVCSLLGFTYDIATLTHVLKHVKLQGRLERHTIIWQDKKLNLLFDVGHNPHAAQFLAAQLKSSYSQSYHGVFGLLADKDLQGVITPLIPFISDWAVAPLDTPRSNSAQTLVDALQKLNQTTMACQSIAEALTWQCNQAKNEDSILIFGSFHVVSEGLNWLSTHK